MCHLEIIGVRFYKMLCTKQEMENAFSSVSSQLFVATSQDCRKRKYFTHFGNEVEKKVYYAKETY